MTEQTRKEPFPAAVSKFGVRVFESRHATQFAMPATQHEYPELLYILDGEGRIAVGKTPQDLAHHFLCQAGNCYLIASGTYHKIIDDSQHPISLYGLAIDLLLNSPSAQINQYLSTTQLPPQMISLFKIPERIRRCLHLEASPDVTSKVQAYAVALELFAQLGRTLNSRGQTTNPVNWSGSSSVDAIDVYLDWLKTHFFEALNLDEAAQMCGLTRKQFTTQFQATTGHTWLGYLNQLRIEHAVTLLNETNLQVTAIAFQSGFEELSTFYRAFKRVTDKKPSDYR